MAKLQASTGSDEDFLAQNGGPINPPPQSGAQLPTLAAPPPNAAAANPEPTPAAAADPASVSRETGKPVTWPFAHPDASDPYKPSIWQSLLDDPRTPTQLRQGGAMDAGGSAFQKAITFGLGPAMEEKFWPEMAAARKDLAAQHPYASAAGDVAGTAPLAFVPGAAGLRGIKAAALASGLMGAQGASQTALSGGSPTDVAISGAGGALGGAAGGLAGKVAPELASAGAAGAAVLSGAPGLEFAGGQGLMKIIKSLPAAMRKTSAQRTALSRALMAPGAAAGEAPAQAFEAARAAGDQIPYLGTTKAQ